jgi:hypothetical protein
MGRIKKKLTPKNEWAAGVFNEKKKSLLQIKN